MQPSCCAIAATCSRYKEDASYHIHNNTSGSYTCNCPTPCSVGDGFLPGLHSAGSAPQVCITMWPLRRAMAATRSRYKDDASYGIRNNTHNSYTCNCPAPCSLGDGFQPELYSTGSAPEVCAHNLAIMLRHCHDK